MFMGFLPLIKPYRIQPFSHHTAERRYYLLGMPVFLLLGNYYLIGIPYFQNLSVFVIGTISSAGFYWLLVVALRLVVRTVIGRFPHVRQAASRTLTMLLLAAGITTGLAVIYVWFYSLIPELNVSFSWDTVLPIWIVSYIVDVFLCTGISVYYTYSQWETNQIENDRLKRMALQHQFDALKGDLNPHFLFNSLNSLSALIGEDTTKAERFVDDLARVYRYLLQAGKHELTSLQTELDYTSVYANLLKTRYGDSLNITFRVADEYRLRSLPPLTIQTLIDNAIKHNVMSVPNPLTIRINTLPDGRLEVKNVLQQKINKIETTRAGLANLTVRYDLLSDDKLVIQQEKEWFIVTVPLIDLGHV
jgi:sensor histidine kinase YesM